ncbi:ATP-dependent protease LonB [Candidatus Woesearchaeota archaeon]|nr:ATP-dependent protease LonB [Candidatus Woesearchaeota archaeon]
MDFKSTSEIDVPKKLANQIIGQSEAVEIIKKAAAQRRHVFLIGTPGTGKSMLGQALSELLPKSKLKDVLAIPNRTDENQPIIKTVSAGKGTDLVRKAKIKAMSGSKNQQLLFFVLAIIALLIPWFIRDWYGDIMAAASLIAGMMFVAVLGISFSVIQKKSKSVGPKTIVNNVTARKAPFIEATGAHAGALLGDVLHDPFQSGGLGTPAHLRVQSGMIHRANDGVLFIDEVSTLAPKTQQDLLTALQEGKYPITGQSERSAGAMVRTSPAPCKFILVAAGNTQTVKKMHPALRSRIRGYGYEVYMNDTIPDTQKNREKFARFVAQEVVKDGKIPHFTKAAVIEIIKEARRRAGRKGHLTLVLRDLGGLIRAAGDLALEQKEKLVKPKHVRQARKVARTLEQQIADKYIEKKKEYEVIRTSGQEIGRVNGLAIIGSETAFSGIVLPIEAAITLGGKRKEFTATGKLGQIAKEAVENVSAIVRRVFGQDLKKSDVFVQFLQTYGEGVEGDSASIAVAVAILSALKNVPVKQNLAMTGSLSVRGEVLPVGGITPKIEAAIEAGIKEIIIPKANEKDVVLSKQVQDKIKVALASDIKDVAKYAFTGKRRKLIIEKFK